MGYAEIPPPGLTKNNCLLTTDLKYPEVSFVVSKSIDLLQVSPFWVVVFFPFATPRTLYVDLAAGRAYK